MKSDASLTLPEFIENLVIKNPNEVISSFLDEINVFTLKELNSRAGLLAKGLLYNGVSKNTTVALVLAGTTNCLTFVLALAKIGAVLVPVNKNIGLEQFEKLLVEQNIHTVGFYADEFLSQFKKIIPGYTQNERGYLTNEKFLHLKNIVTFGSVKNRGIFTTRELMLLGDHIDDIEMETIIGDISPDDTFVNHIVFEKDSNIIVQPVSHRDLVEQNKTFHDLQNYLLNLI